jgi:flagellar secretion chaperone FliS
MHGAMARAAQTYYQTQIQSQSPVELVVMLYDGALRFMRAAADAVEKRDLVGKREAMSRTMAIVSELQSSLNLSAGGEIAKSLDDLYTYINGRLIEANINTSAEPIKEAIRLLTPLRDAWAQIAAPGQAPSQERP